MAKQERVRDGWTMATVPIYLITDSRVGGIEIRVFAYLSWWRSTYADWPGVKQVATELGTNSRVVRRALSTLEETGYIDKTLRPGKTSEYTLTAHPNEKLPGTAPTRVPLQDQHRALFAALAEICEIDAATITAGDRGKLNQAARVLREAGATPEDVCLFRDYWYDQDWRGLKGYAPHPSQVRSEWGRAMAWQDDQEPDYPVYE